MNKQTQIIAALTLVLGVSLTLMPGGDSRAEDRIGEPLDDARKARLQGTHLKFIAETGRIVVHEDGRREIIWDPPALPTLQESITMGVQAAEAGDMDLLPLCTDEYLGHLKAQDEESGVLVTPGDPYMFPACNGIPSKVGIGSPGVPALSTSDPDHTGYYYDGTVVSEGINGAISRDNPSLASDEWVAARFLISKTLGGNTHWLEGGWTENYPVFGDDDQHPYTQQCDSVRGANNNCDWYSFASTCDDASNTLINIASDSDNKWDSFCWDFGKRRWIRMWSDFDPGDDDADALEAFFEAAENQNGTISMGSVRFYNLDLRDATTWRDWTTTYSADTHWRQQGGYTTTTATLYEDFTVNN